jgi:CubicO group peptidase (beta-lactamase class C family)
VLDLAKWDSALIGESILTTASKTQMWTPFTLDSGRSTGYGFGWAVTQTAAGKVVHHNGGGFGFSTGFYRYLDAGLSVAALTNTRWQDAPRPPNNGDSIARAVAALYDPSLAWPNGPEDDRLPAN